MAGQLIVGLDVSSRARAEEIVLAGFEKLKAEGH